MIYSYQGSVSAELQEKELKTCLYSAFEKLGKPNKVLAIPPDFTRFHSHSGELTRYTYQYYRDKLTDILPALGTHFPMTRNEIKTMYGDVPLDLFKVHNWKADLKILGEVPKEFIEDVSEGKVSYSWPAQVNKLLVDGDFDLILSFGQVVPHEVTGMTGYNKNILIGTGGREGINRSHFLGAVYGMERIMGQIDTPVRRVLNYATENFAKELAIVYVLTVIGKNESEEPAVKGLFVGDDEECFKMASKLSLKVNFSILSEPLKKVVVYLNPEEFKSTWLGNKSIYRTRMAIADDGELIILAPGVCEFGEDKGIDALIRKYGYRATPEILQAVEDNEDLRRNLGAAAHLIHGSSENRFTITYCPGYLSKEEIESVNFQFSDLQKMLKIYDPKTLREGFNNLPNGEEIFFISNPALGLWAYEKTIIV